MARIKLILSYDGTDYCGWQKQKEHAFASDKPSVQETVEKALEQILRHPIELSASGRTDAGVHAVAQVAHFDSERTMPKDLCWALHSKLPTSITAKAAFEAPDDFHSTISAEKKIYRYWIWNNMRSTALLSRYSWGLRKPLNLDFLNEAASHLLGEQDFASFRSMGTPVKTTVREIYSAQWSRPKPSLLEFKVCGNGFMKQMVRNLVGTMADLDIKSQPAEMMREIINHKDRRKAGPTAPPQGLALLKVYYPQTLDKRCRRL
jgi:tRNA pseudouridine38-40 synthase